MNLSDYLKCAYDAFNYASSKISSNKLKEVFLLYSVNADYPHDTSALVLMGIYSKYRLAENEISDIAKIYNNEFDILVSTPNFTIYFLQDSTNFMHYYRIERHEVKDE